MAGHGVGEYVIFEDSYREIARVRAGNGYRGDLHEFLITPQDTALLTAYNPVPADLSAVGSPKYGAVWDGIAQELDIETGRVETAVRLPLQQCGRRANCVRAGDGGGGESLPHGG